MIDKQTSEVQNAVLKILDYYLKVVERLDLKYIFLGGSLIGAVRHQGFIPWDDDLDIGMERTSYDKLIAYLEKENMQSSPFFLQTFDTDSNYGHGYSKILLKHTHISEAMLPNVKAKMCVFIDIFPLDNVPEQGPSMINHTLFKISEVGIHTRLQYNTEVSTEKKILHKVIMILLFFVKTKTMVKIRESLVKRYSNTTKFVVNRFTVYNPKNEFILKDNIEKTQWLNFEGRKIRAPKEWDSYLKQIYGDYMKLPPVEEQVNRHLSFVDLGKYKGMEK